MKTYNVVFNEGVDDGVFAISVVKSPAMESNFIALNKQKFKLAEVDAVKFMLAGVILVPDKEVYRNQNGEEFNIKFSEDTIFDVANNFIQKGYQQNSSIEHDTKIEGVSIVQSWVVKDPNQDTANAYGLPKEDIKKGSWVGLYKCDNKEIYDKALSGEIKGFSIDGLFSLEEVNLKSEVKMNKDDLEKTSNELKEWAISLFKAKPTLVELGMQALADGETKIEYTSDTPTVGDDVWVMNGEERVLLPVGGYPLEDGSILVVAEEGKIAEVKPKVDESNVDTDLGDDKVAPTQGEIEQMIKSVLVKYKSENDKQTEVLLSAQAEKFTLELTAVKDELEVLKKTPAITSLSSAPKQPKAYKDMSNLEQMKHNRG